MHRSPQSEASDYAYSWCLCCDMDKILTYNILNFDADLYQMHGLQF